MENFVSRQGWVTQLESYNPNSGKNLLFICLSFGFLKFLILSLKLSHARSVNFNLLLFTELN